MRKNLIRLIGIAFAVAVMATGVFYGLFFRALGSRVQTEEKGIVVAARDLKPGQVLTQADLKTVAVERTDLKEPVTTASQVVGMAVLEPVTAGEPLRSSRLTPRDAVETAAFRVPEGFRAISITTTNSQGILDMLAPGSRVDVQVLNNGGDAEGARVMTLLEDVEVLQAASQPRQPGVPGSQMVTLLTRRQDADALALADSAARVRLLLRNPGDRSTSPRSRLSLARLFDGARGTVLTPAVQRTQPSAWPQPDVRKASLAPQASPSSAAAATSAGRSEAREIHFLVRIASAGSGAAAKLGIDPKLTLPAGRLLLAAVRPESGEELLVERLAESHQLDILSTSRLSTGANRSVSFHAGSQNFQPGTAALTPARNSTYGLNIVLSPSIASSGAVRVRVQPEVTTPSETGTSTRKFESEVELADGETCVITGLVQPPDLANLLDRLFPGRRTAETHRELLVLVTAQAAAEQRAALGPAR